MLVTLRIAAAALVAAGGLFYFAVFPPKEATAFAEVAQRLRNFIGEPAHDEANNKWDSRHRQPQYYLHQVVDDVL